MKIWLFLTLFVSVPLYVATADAGEPDGVVEAKVVVVRCEGDGGDVSCVHTGDGEGHVIMVQAADDGTGNWIADGNSHKIVIEATGGPEDGAVSTAVFQISADDADGLSWVQDGDGEGVALAMALGAGDDDVKRQVRVLTRNLTSIQKRAFLGVNLGSSTGDDDGGVRISGVVEDGPAAKAGLKAGDVVVEIDGDSVVSGIKALTTALGARDPGDDVEVVVLRDGKEVAFDVTLGSRGGIATSFAFGPEGIGEIEDRINVRGHIVLRNDEGDWEVKDLGNLEGLKGLPGNLKMFMPTMGSRSVAIAEEEGEKVVTINRSVDGESVAIERHGDGDIKVTRVDQDGEQTTDTYADEDELQAADEEAYDLLQSIAGDANGFNFADIDVEDGTFDFNFTLAPEDIHENIMLWREELDGTLGEAREAYELALEELGSLKDDLHSQHGEDFERLQGLFLQRPGAKNFKFPGIERFELLGKPKHSFEVRSDGTIEVKIRKGDSELVQLFDNASDMENREPALYQKYSKLMGENE